MFKRWQTWVLGQAVLLLLLAMPVLAQERTSVGQHANTPQSVEFETLNTFIRAIKTRLQTDTANALGPNERIETEFKQMIIKLNQVDVWLTELEGASFTGAETDSRTCALGKAIMPSCTNLQRQVWRGTSWTCEPRQVFEVGAVCVTSSTPPPTNCPNCNNVGGVQLCSASGGPVMNCCNAWQCRYTMGGAENVCP